MWPLIVTIAVTTLIYTKILSYYKYWTTKGVFQITPWPIFGNISPTVFRTKSFTDVIQDIYNAYPERKYYGIYQFFKPTLVIRCPDLIKSIFIKEFETFPEHRLTLPADADPLYTNNLFSVRGGDRWHNLRSTLTPSFTSSKLKGMFGLVQECAVQCINHIEKRKGTIVVDMRDVFGRFANDVIGTTAFGVTCNSFDNPKNEFYLMAKEATDMTEWKTLKLFLNHISPLLVKVTKISILSEGVNAFFRSTITNSLRFREEHNIVRCDMVNLLMEARKTRPDTALTDEDIAAQAFVFLIGGYDTSARAMCFTAYELALNLGIQKRLQEEIDNVLKSGEVTYDSLLSMKYMDMVISESLRKWPPATLTDRRSVKPFLLKADNDSGYDITLDTETEVWIPIYGLHRDPKYYPKPDHFDPERFSDTNKSSINQFTYIPFGAGPKNCIGSRFALLEVKLIIFYILRKFDILTTHKTPIPIILDKRQMFPTPVGGFWLELRPRNSCHNH